MEEFHVYGPPGCGKTDRLATRDIPRAVGEYGPDKVMVTSFTKAGAREIATRESRLTGKTIGINKRNVGTLHSICYHALGQPEIAEVKIKDWNDSHPGYPITGVKVTALDEGGISDGGKRRGDRLLSELNRYRAKLDPRHLWKPDVIEFEKKWNQWKNDSGLKDFTDLIEQAPLMAPNSPEVLFVDEAQDFTPLQLKLVRNWALDMRWLVLVGDPDQAIFSFMGADPDAFLALPVDAQHKTVLRQSYRVPVAVHKRSMQLITRVSNREPKEYRPRDAAGTTRNSGANFRNPGRILQEIMQHADKDKTVMVLGSCSYMLDPLIKELRSMGLPFCNPYRPTPAWNPLASGDQERTTGTDILLNFLELGPDRPYHTIQQLLGWAPYMQIGDTGLKRKRGKSGLAALKKAVEEGQPGLESARNVLAQIFNPPALDHILGRDTEWLIQNVKRKHAKGLDYPIRVYENWGIEPLCGKIKTIVGTIHSCKGGQADVVYLFPDISREAKEFLERSQEGYDDVCRLFYVGMTRAKEELIITDPHPYRKGRLYVEQL